MALSKEIQIDQVSIDYDNFGRIIIVEHTIIEEDDTYLVGKKTKRYIYPGYAGNSNIYNVTDVSDEHEAVRKLAELWDWTDTHNPYAKQIGAEII